MKSNKKKKGNQGTLLLLLIIVAFVGVFFVDHQQKNYTKTTAEEKKAEEAEPSTNVYYVNFDHSDPKNETCKNAIRDLSLNVFYDSNNNLKVSCEPLNVVKKEDTLWTNNQITLTLSGSGVSPATYSCQKGSTSSNTHPLAITITKENTIRIKAKEKFTYQGVTCNPNDAWIDFYMDRIVPLYQQDGADNYIEEGPDGGTVTMDGGGSTIDVVEEVVVDPKKEEDDPTFTPPSTVVVTPAIGKPYEIPKDLYKADKKTPYLFTDFEKEFKNAPANKKKEYTFKGDTIEAAQGQAGLIKLACDYKLVKEDIDGIEKLNRQELQDPVTGELTDYYYDDSNTSYYKGTWTKTITKHFYYTFHTIPKKSTVSRTEKMTFSCTKTCEEIVKVEYGPPIQVDAGMCFEYRFKVSSIVNCTSEPKGDAKAPKKPSSYKICKLKPVCSHGSQAGPNEQFESCVESCDGGEYTEACSNKCYNQVYANNGSVKAQGANFSPEDFISDAEELAWSKMPDNINSFSYNNYVNGEVVENTPPYNWRCIRGQHYVDGSLYKWCPTHKKSTVKISNNGGKDKQGSTKHASLSGYLGVWYYYQHYKTNWYNGHRYATGSKGDGFIRAVYSSGQCTDHCVWKNINGCSKNSYFYFDYTISNYYPSASNMTANAKSVRCPHMWVWDSTEKKYSYKQICTATDLRNADYANNVHVYKESIEKLCVGTSSCTQSTATYTINFKYKKQGETKVTTVNFPLTKEKEQIHSEKNTEPALNNNPEILLRYGGCYASHGAKKWYLTEWTFPGTWLPHKGKDRIYGNADADENDLVRGLVCVPYKLSDTNAKWAKYYVKVIKGESLDPSKWEFKTNTDGSAIVSDTSYDGYNINGSVTDFGLFKWNFSINCFYALTNTFDPCPDPDCCPNPPCDGGGGDDPEIDPVDIRSVDTADPFLENSTTQSRVQYRKEARKTGFNWTKPATLIKYTEAAGGYNQNPADLLTYMKGKDTFNEKYKEYEFTLDVQTLRKLRSDYRMSKGYNSFISEPKYTPDGHGVSHYRSSLLRELTSTKFSENSSQCNNAYCTVIGGK